MVKKNTIYILFIEKLAIQADCCAFYIDIINLIKTKIDNSDTYFVYLFTLLLFFTNY